MSHELVHQCFGNLVTMPWWNELWLNEALATWLGRRTEGVVFPEDASESAFQVAVDHAMAQDALADARSIRQPVETPHDIYNAFYALRTRAAGSACDKRDTHRWDRLARTMRSGGYPSAFATARTAGSGKPVNS